VGTLKGHATLNVTSARLDALLVTPDPATQLVGRALQFASKGSYSDGSQWDLTAVSSWSTSNAAVAQAGAKGNVSCIGVGTSAVYAAFDGFNSAATLTVVPVVLTGIAITPSYPAVSATLSEQLTATATYSDSSTSDVTTSVTWSSSLPGIASVSPSGLAQGISPGTTTISATLNGISGTAPLTVKSIAATYQVDTAHAGAQPGDALKLPLSRRWSLDFGYPVSYPVIANGSVFIAVGSNSPTLYALDELTGATRWGPLAVGGAYPWAALAYDRGSVFAINSSGGLSAFDAQTGHTLWSEQLPGQYVFTSPPTAVGGTVYVGGAGTGGTVYAVNEADGTVLWTQSVMNGDDSSPAVTSQGVFVSYACNQAYGFTPSSGAAIWHDSGPCEGGGGKTVSVFGGKVYTRDSMGDLVLDATTGSQTGTYASLYIPAFSGGTGYFTPTPQLQAVPLGGATVTWTFGSTSDPVVTAPVVVGANVVTATATKLYVLNAANGSVASSDALAGVRTPDEQNVSAPLGGLAAADGVLVVPAGTGLVAY
jgi:outer membrane protein assembly factor BamB